jgi:hypothetical protein
MNIVTVQFRLVQSAAMFMAGEKRRLNQPVIFRTNSCCLKSPWKKGNQVVRIFIFNLQIYGYTGTF